jgi:putative CocE/NonD family hydrolase
MRGSGSSDGVLYDEYSEIELQDGEAVLKWIAAQEWCDGNIGMIGISWGGITGLQLAQRQAKYLKTVIALGATEFRYYDDAGYYMGCMVGQTLGWATIMFGYNTRPPDPKLAGETWKETWLKRLRETPHYLEKWFSPQTMSRLKSPSTPSAVMRIAGQILFQDCLKTSPHLAEGYRVHGAIATLIWESLDPLSAFSRTLLAGSTVG